jgi:hypothetical protein
MDAMHKRGGFCEAGLTKRLRAAMQQKRGISAVLAGFSHQKTPPKGFFRTCKFVFSQARQLA